MSLIGKTIRRLFRQYPAVGHRAVELGTAAALVFGAGFAQSYALTLGEIEVRSRLGQPLDAIVHVSAAPGEVLRADCISVAESGSGLPAVTNVRLSLSTRLSPGTLRLECCNIRHIWQASSPRERLIVLAKETRKPTCNASSGYFGPMVAWPRSSLQIRSTPKSAILPDSWILPT